MTNHLESTVLQDFASVNENYREEGEKERGESDTHTHTHTYMEVHYQTTWRCIPEDSNSSHHCEKA
jgi:hypothetical protein